MLLNPDSICYLQWLFLCKKSRSGITLLFRIVSVLMIALKRQLDLSLLQLGFLDAEDIRIRLPEEIHKAFAHTGT